ncbi:PaaI family thioesterase [Hydrogenophaga electricum]|uniref:Thioesterase n=1 Tax=Hydrogenophaga electricum TaxID=1230953 RepID=A0ABQ6C5S0_9BURK|nr:PaaI family thioesterase [Hydrogenophaga electricum]GLS14354.1 thioesterase [Hydrogenophaga electricum]
MTEAFHNPDRALIQRFLDQGGQAIAIDSNPMARALGATLLRVDADKGQVALAFEPEGLFIQGTGVLQGGAVSAMLDFAMAFATLARQPVQGSCATAQMSTAFLRPAPQGRYIAEGTVDRCGRTLAFTQARLLHEPSGHLVATASSSLVVLG